MTHNSVNLSIVYSIHLYESGFSLRILVAGERCNVTEEYFERGSTSEYKIAIGYRTFAGELCVVNGEFSDLRCRMNILYKLLNKFIRLMISLSAFSHMDTSDFHPKPGGRGRLQSDFARLPSEAYLRLPTLLMFSKF